MADDPADSVSMVDVLEGAAALEDEANAVLGGSDEKNCTYSEGYVDRQALYSCQTCKTQPGQSAGVCLACSLHCHDGHDLVELYTKRHFRCDCGNSKFTDATCKLLKDKEGENSQNEYNQNFSGHYCSCGGIYPDPDDEVEDEMIQCIICEDWFHSRHLGTLSPEEFQEMTCDTCMKRLASLLCHYAGSSDFSATVPLPKSVPQNETVDIMTLDNRPPEKCKLLELKSKSTKTATEPKAAASFWKDGWRQRLCRCETCKAMYKSMHVEFLTNENDTIAAYETKGKTKMQASGSVYDNAMLALDGMERTQKVEVLHEFNVMKDELADYLKQFAEDGKVVKKEDIDSFFSELSSRKRPRLELSQNCR